MRLFAAEGAEVIVHDLPRSDGAAPAQATFIAGDLRDMAALLADVARAGPLDILVNNAATRRLSRRRGDVKTTKLPVSTRVAVTSAACPECTAPSSRIPSRYRRQLFDLPSHGRCVRLTMAVHQFRRGNQVLPRRIFGKPW